VRDSVGESGEKGGEEGEEREGDEELVRVEATVREPSGERRGSVERARLVQGVQKGRGGVGEGEGVEERGIQVSVGPQPNTCCFGLSQSGS